MKWANWKDSFVEYITNSNNYWKDVGIRQNNKLIEIKKIISRLYGISDAAFIAFALDLAESRNPIPSKLYISNIGGSGSHWLSKMIESTAGYFDVGEVYIPISFYDEIMKSGHLEQAAKFLDSVEMLHGFLYRLRIKDVPEAHLINSAHGVKRLRFHKKLFPDASFIHLFRDPRDRTLSITFRKADWRAYAHPEKGDKDFLIFNARSTFSNFEHYANQPIKADIELKYEDLRQNTTKWLAEINKLVHEERNLQLIKDISSDFSSENLLLSDNEYKRGNLSESGASKSWRTYPNKVHLRIMHAILKPTIKALSYELSDCFGFEFSHYRPSPIHRGEHDLILRFSKFIKILENQNKWQEPTPQTLNANKGNAILMLDAMGLNSDQIIQLLSRIQISQLCLNGVTLKTIAEVFQNLPKVNIPLIDASSIKGFQFSYLSKCKNLKVINLTGTGLAISKPTSYKIIQDF